MYGSILLKTTTKKITIKYSWMLEGIVGWIVALYLCRGVGVENLFLTLTLIGVGGAYYVCGECLTDNFVVANPVGIKSTTAYLNINRGTCFSIGGSLYQVEGIYTERLYTWKHSYMYEAYPECQHSEYSCTGSIGNFCDQETECSNKCKEISGAYKTDCVIRSGFSFSECLNIDVNVKGELCIGWRTDTVVRHYESTSEAVDQYVEFRIERGGLITKAVLHVGVDENSETIGLTSLAVAKTLTAENVYLLNGGARCSQFTPQEGEICTVGGLTYKHVISPDCLEADLQWDLEKREYNMKFTTEQMKNWLSEYSAPCESLTITEESNITLRVKQQNGKARITVATYEDTNLRGVTICSQIIDARVKVEQGKGEWITTSKITLGARTNNECLIAVNVDPCTVIGPTRKVVGGSFSWTIEAACGIRTPSALKLFGGDVLLSTVKLPKLYTDVNYDITYGVQTLQVLSSRIGDILGGTEDYLSIGNYFRLLSKDMINMIIKVLITLVIMYVGWLCLMSGMTPLGIAIFASSVIPWVSASGEYENEEETCLLSIKTALLIIIAVFGLIRIRGNHILKVCTLPQYITQLVLRKVASSSIFQDQYHTAACLEDFVKLFLVALNTTSFNQFLIISFIVVCWIKLTTFCRDFISAFTEGLDVSYENDVYCTISMLLARIVPNKTWYNKPLVSIDGLGSPTRKLNRPLINIQTAYRAMLRSEPNQVFLHEVVLYFAEHADTAEKEFGNCIWSVQDGKITGARHTLRLCGCDWCTNHEATFDVVGKYVNNDVHYEIVDERPNDKSGKWKTDYGVYAGYVESNNTFVKVYNLVDRSPDNDQGKSLADEAAKALKYVQQQQFSENSRGRENGVFAHRQFYYGDLTTIDISFIKLATTECIIRDFQTYSFTKDLKTVAINFNVQASTIYYNNVNQIVIDCNMAERTKLEKHEFKIKQIYGKYVIGLNNPSYVPVAKEWVRTNAWESYSPCMSWFTLAPSKKKIEHLNKILKVKGENKLIDGTYWTARDGMIFTAAHAARLDWLPAVPKFITISRDIITIDTSRTGREAVTNLINGEYIAKADGRTYTADVKKAGSEIEITVKDGKKAVELKGLSGMTFTKDDRYFTITIGNKTHMYTNLPQVGMLDLMSSEFIFNEYVQQKDNDIQSVTMGDYTYAIINHKKEGSTLVGPTGTITKSMVAKWPYSYHTKSLTFATEQDNNPVYEQHKRGLRVAPSSYKHYCGEFNATMKKSLVGGLTILLNIIRHTDSTINVEYVCLKNE